MKLEDIASYLQRALEDAKSLDNWHKYGEGYTSLRQDIQKLINDLEIDQVT